MIGLRSIFRWQLEVIQSLNLARVKDELVVLRKSVKELHDRSILLMPIIKEAQEEEKLKNIWGVKDSNPISSEKMKKRKKRKRTKMEEQNIEAAKNKKYSE